MKLQNKWLIHIIFFLYLSFLTLDFFYPELSSLSNGLKYLSQCTIFLLSITQGIPIPMLLTLVCDYFLLFTSSYPFGVAIFVMVHLLYAIRLADAQARDKYLIFIYTLPFLLLLFPLEIGCCVYAGAFLFHFSQLFNKMKKKPAKLRWLYFTAMLFFLLCDIHVVLFQITKNAAYGNFIWLFYTPSQLLLALILHQDSSTNWKPLHKHSLYPQNHEKKKEPQ